jgi:hypothetical protein
MSVAHRTLAELEAATAASALAIEEAKAAWSAVWRDGAGDNTAATAAWERVEELQGEWESAAWEECEALKAAARVEGPVERGLSLSVYETRELPRYEEAHGQLGRMVMLLRARGYAPASVEPWAEEARAIGAEAALIRAFVEAHRAEAAAEAELAVLREKDAAATVAAFGAVEARPKRWLPPNWDARVAAAGRSAAAREVIASSPLHV